MAFITKAIRSLLKLHKQTTSTAATERLSKAHTETPTSHHIRKAELLNERAGEQSQDVTAPETLAIHGVVNARSMGSTESTGSEPRTSHLMEEEMRQLGNGDLNQHASPPGTPIIYNAVKVGMGLMKEVSTAFGPLESVVRGLTFIFEHHEKWAANKGVIQRLINRVEMLRTAFERMVGGQYSDKENERQNAFLRKLQDIANDIETITNKHKLSGYIAAGADKDILSALVDDIRDALVDYQTITQIEIDMRTAALITAEEDRLLLQLPRAPNASHLSEVHKSCLKGTRTSLLDDLEAWSEDPHSQHIFWLNGHAGSGKSTLIQSFCQNQFSAGRLGASFFCSATYPDRNDLKTIFPTLAFQLARRFPAFRERIVTTLKNRPDVTRESLKTQFAELIIAPLENTGVTTIIVIDALDECQETADVSTILSLLPEYITRIPSVKFFVTARPEPPIRLAFRLESLQSLTKIIVLGDVQRSSVDHDIYLFLKTRLSDAMKGRSDIDLPSPWPSDEDLNILTEKSGQLFIFAATAAAFITSPYDDPAERLALLKEMPEKNTGIDHLYRMVLLHGYPETTDPEYQAHWRLIVGSILLLLRGHSRNALSIFLDLTLAKVSSILRPLHAVLKISESFDGPITIYHKSFHDYMTDSARCTDPTFFIDDDAYHTQLAKHCLRFLSTHLQEESHRSRDASWVLAEERPEHKILVYSCINWQKACRSGTGITSRRIPE
ncbi:Vegetative incompatibility protein HET-E-1 [Hypsizygus marmoreus]|uniref:Vegetative incompatibility protein HET-E-1 n=1 Tax=Hypsizygus marmoreus TaxID=39966 RepID=A0A369JJY1_HYPMA|nr:Vegetative incompatibility protein HET-E-1 [Hypsizygus marmoreus]